MKTASLSVLGACALALSAAAPGFAVQPDDALEGFRQTGQTQSCVALNRVRSMKPVDETRMLVEMRGGATYLNTLRSRCSNIDRSYTYIEYRTTGSQLCQGEILTVVDQGSRMMTGSCSLGAYELLEPVEPAGA
ncbi:hypothetical protein FKB34_09660 [Glycocaulis profundi]|nr:hypothetical protein FKB34_09660 [Glycocaulis profundi]